MNELLRIDRPAPRVLRVLINRVPKRNAVDYDTRQALIDAMSAAQRDAECGALVLGGVDRVFSSGGDLPSMVGLSEQAARARMAHGATLCRLVANSPFPVVSAGEGFCAGAAVGLALLGDAIIVGRDTRILFPFLKIGLVPDWALLRSLPLRVGAAAARRLFTSGKPVTGAEAFRIGLADEDVGEGDVMLAAIERASALSRLSPSAYARMKQRLLSPALTLDEALSREEGDQAEMLTGADFREGFAAFSEKREPAFQRGTGTKS
ncbi:MAG: enoyl-CoA hydratase/isomerase family protein [Panacagrimonas sp.]